MPVHNGGDYLAPAVQSILAQQDVELELLLIDDHSSDSAIESLAQDPRIRAIKSNQRGLVPALNTGIKHAQGEWLARMDADDIAEPQRLKTQLDFMHANRDIGICGTQVAIFKDQGKADEGYQRYQQWINSLTSHQQIQEQFFVESAIPHPTAFMRLSSLKQLGGYQDNLWPEDYDLWCRAYLAGFKFAKPKGQLLHWRDYQKRTSRQDSRYKKNAFLRCKAFYLTKWLAKQGHQNCTIWGTGPTGLKLHDFLQESGIQIDGFVDINPKLRGQCKRGKPVIVVSKDLQPDELKSIISINLIAVSARGAREKIEVALNAIHYQRNRDYVLVA